MRWELGVVICEDFRWREWDIEFVFPATCGGMGGLPEFEVPVLAKTICCLGEKEDKERSDLFRGVVEVILGELSECRMARAQKIEKVSAEGLEMGCEDAEWIRTAFTSKRGESAKRLGATEHLHLRLNFQLPVSTHPTLSHTPFFGHRFTAFGHLALATYISCSISIITSRLCFTLNIY